MKHGLLLIALLLTLVPALVGLAAEPEPVVAPSLPFSLFPPPLVEEGEMKVSPIPEKSLQALLVLSENENAKTAVLQRFARVTALASWTSVGDAIPVVLGKKGMAWGVGLHQIPHHAAYKKAEGDGKSPMGVFALGPAYGYASASEARTLGIRIAYLQVDDRHLWVDDRNSNWYNLLVDQTRVARPDWKSTEKMRRSDELYRWGLVVGHNRPHPLGVATLTAETIDPKPFKLPLDGPVPTDTPIPGAGSAIFMHLWRSADSGTAGCTAMTREDFERLLAWLDPAAEPILVQFTRDAYKEWRDSWKLP